LTDLGWQPRELVVRTASHESVLDRLGAVRLDLSAPRHTGTDSGLARFAHRAGISTAFSVRLNASATPAGLDLTISVPSTSDDRMTAVSVNFGDDRFEFFVTAPEMACRFDDYSLETRNGAPVTNAARRIDGRDELAVHIPWPRLGSPRAILPLLLGVRRQVRPWGATDGAAILPLLLELPA
jgi:hypothetical protein